MKAREKKRYGPRGLGEIRVLADGSAKVYLQVPMRNAAGEIDSYNTVVYPIAKEDVAAGTKAAEGIYIELSPDETTIRSVRPWEGRFRARFTGLVQKKTGLVSLKPIQTKHVALDDGREWDIPAHVKFFALNEIVSNDKHGGMVFVVGLPFLFERDMYGGVEVAFDYKPHYDELWNYMSALGIEASEFMPGEPVTVAQQFEEAARQGNEFYVTFQNGWTKEVIPLGVGE